MFNNCHNLTTITHKHFPCFLLIFVHLHIYFHIFITLLSVLSFAFLLNIDDKHFCMFLTCHISPFCLYFSDFSFLIIFCCFFSYYILKIQFVCLFLVVLGLDCCAQAFYSCGKWGLLSSCRVQTSCSGFSCCGAQAVCTWASVAVACRLSCPVACVIFLDQESNLHPLHWQADS